MHLVEAKDIILYSSKNKLTLDLNAAARHSRVTLRGVFSRALNVFYLTLAKRPLQSAVNDVLGARRAGAYMLMVCKRFEKGYLLSYDPSVYPEKITLFETIPLMQRLTSSLHSNRWTHIRTT
jgi:hypothetical protein